MGVLALDQEIAELDAAHRSPVNPRAVANVPQDRPVVLERGQAVAVRGASVLPGENEAGPFRPLPPAHTATLRNLARVRAT